LLVVDSKWEKALSFPIVFFSEPKDTLLDFSFPFDSSLVSFTLKEFKLEWDEWVVFWACRVIAKGFLAK
jgi:hypothetical protein